jgi:hypothetical protein
MVVQKLLSFNFISSLCGLYHLNLKNEKADIWTVWGNSSHLGWILSLHPPKSTQKTNRTSQNQQRKDKQEGARTIKKMTKWWHVRKYSKPTQPVIHRGTSIQTPILLLEIKRAQGRWNYRFKVLGGKKKNCQPRILYEIKQRYSR